MILPVCSLNFTEDPLLKLFLIDNVPMVGLLQIWQDSNVNIMNTTIEPLAWTKTSGIVFVARCLEADQFSDAFWHR